MWKTWGVNIDQKENLRRRKKEREWQQKLYIKKVFHFLQLHFVFLFWLQKCWISLEFLPRIWSKYPKLVSQIGYKSHSHTHVVSTQLRRRKWRVWAICYTSTPKFSRTIGNELCNLNLVVSIKYSNGRDTQIPKNIHLSEILSHPCYSHKHLIFAFQKIK